MKSNSRGFTLLEILVALAVAAIVLTALVQGLSRYANQYIHLREAIIARSIGSGHLTRYILDKDYIPPGYVDNAGVRWELHFEEEEYFFQDMDGLKKVTLGIYDGNERRVATLHAVAYRPGINSR